VAIGSRAKYKSIQTSQLQCVNQLAAALGDNVFWPCIPNIKMSARQVPLWTKNRDRKHKQCQLSLLTTGYAWQTPFQCTTIKPASIFWQSTITLLLMQLTELLGGLTALVLQKGASKLSIQTSYWNRRSKQQIWHSSSSGALMNSTWSVSYLTKTERYCTCLSTLVLVFRAR